MAQTDLRGDNLTRSHTQIRQMRLFLPHPLYAAGQIRLDGNPTINPTEVLHHLSPNTLIQAPAKPVTTQTHTHTNTKARHFLPISSTVEWLRASTHQTI